MAIKEYLNYKTDIFIHYIQTQVIVIFLMDHYTYWLIENQIIFIIILND